MNYPEFREAIFLNLQKILPKDVTTRLLEVEKLNGFLRHGISFTKEDTFFSPTIYLESFYEAYVRGSDIYTLAEKLLKCYNEETEELPLSVYNLRDFDSSKDNIFAKLIHIKENENLLKEVPYLTYLDFAIVPYYEVDDKELFQGTVMIYKKFLQNWEITEEELLEWAIQNTNNKKLVNFVNIVDLLGAKLTQEEKSAIEENGNVMYVLTNEKKHLGAILAYFPETLHLMQKKLGGDYYLLPASIHEWVVVPAYCVEDESYLKWIVEEVNRTELMPEEVLSNNIYLYDSSSQNIRIC